MCAHRRPEDKGLGLPGSPRPHLGQGPSEQHRVPGSCKATHRPSDEGYA